MIDLRVLRAKAGLTQAQVAERLGVTTGRVSQIEGGANLRLSTLGEYLAALTADEGEAPMNDPAIATLIGTLSRAADLIGEAHRLADPATYTGQVDWTLTLGRVDGTTEELTPATAAGKKV
ncbi:helix-turn-helix transcriptional regulator [Mycobacterium sp. M1]|uniref:Helix-turn-helix transcriptional regulator n=1 Tax=Mycolicibacter acidiphilus TaxID=2835306 RepID=A0ABS5RDL1_9MYCO|nr:helix-turn-helix transcriptional regulator [Mycolicibacter acidiphilus]MBS9532370.1 helix-turn-helix transcriptional regulator [Mycolicibacter acidiphilus]